MALCFLFGACQKTGGTASCTTPRALIPAALCFSGFTLAQLDTLVLGTYAAGSNFRVRVRQDTLRTDSIDVIDGNAFKNGAGFAALETGQDYRVFVPATAQTFSITGLRRTGDSLYHYTSDNGCNHKGSELWSPDSAIVDGVPRSLARNSQGPANNLYLSR